jgi:hypothetical protein
LSTGRELNGEKKKRNDCVLKGLGEMINAKKEWRGKEKLKGKNTATELRCCNFTRRPPFFLLLINTRTKQRN